jgi:hypothetical protein
VHLSQMPGVCDTARRKLSIIISHRRAWDSGALLLLLAMPLALGSWWSILLVVPFFPVLVWRILDAEDFLRKDLPGYAEYMQRVRYRLVPWVW